MTIICYTDPSTGEQKWEEREGSAEVAIEGFRKDHPDIKPEYQFLPKDNTLPNDEAPWRRGFAMTYEDYGFEPTELDSEMRLKDGRRAFFRGIDTRRLTHVAVVWDCRKQDYLHMTPGDVKVAIGRFLTEKDKTPSA